MSASRIEPRRVVIVGGGVGSLEAVLALRDMTDGAADVTVVCPDDRFALRAMTTAEPFAAGQSDLGPLSEILADAGATLHPSLVAAVHADEHMIECSDGSELSYDALILAPGGRMRRPYEQALTFGIGDPLAFNGLLADVEQGYTDSVGFVVPDGVAWSLPLYELALMAARQVWGMGRDVELTFVTPEPAPLAIFGPQAGAAVAELFHRANIALHCGRPVAISQRRMHLLDESEDIAVDRIVTIPRLEGPRLPGVPADGDGFIPVDSYGRVRGLVDVYAVGDAANLLVKQGGLACQQADVVAAHIAHAAGAPVESPPLQPVLRGRLTTGRADHFLRRDLAQSQGTAEDEALWWPPVKVSGRYLGAWLTQRRLGSGTAAAPADPSPGDGLDVSVAVDRTGGAGP